MEIDAEPTALEESVAVMVQPIVSLGAMVMVLRSSVAPVPKIVPFDISSQIYDSVGVSSGSYTVALQDNTSSLYGAVGTINPEETAGAVFSIVMLACVVAPS